MSKTIPDFQPGVLLHEVIVGAFRARGTTFDAWCRDHGISQSDARNFTFGQSRGERGKKMLEKMIDGAGREFVLAAYRARVVEHLARLNKGAA